MKQHIYSFLQLREIFHLEFLKWLGLKIKPNNFALKGGVNLRFFFNSSRYSEDMDIDIENVSVSDLQDTVMKVLRSIARSQILQPFGITRVVPPDITKAMQTETTQRFKIHLITPANEDIFTKVEFSRRGFKTKPVAEFVSNFILREYQLAPIIVSHYDLISTIIQKIGALSGRTIVQARDIFDLYVLSTQLVEKQKVQITDLSSRQSPSDPNRLWKAAAGLLSIKIMELSKAQDRIFEVGFEQFRDTVVSYLSQDEQNVYNSPGLWDEIGLKVSGFLEELKNG